MVRASSQDCVQEDIHCTVLGEDDLPETGKEIRADGFEEAVVASAMAGVTGLEYVDATPPKDPERYHSERKEPKDPARDLSGKTFGNWTVLEFVRTTPHGTLWRCECKCGTVREVWGAQLKAGRSRSCGKRGCRMRNAPSLKSASDQLTDERSADIYRFYAEIHELLNSKMWRCRSDGSLYPVAMAKPNWLKWGLFMDWSCMAGGYKRGKVLCVKKDWIYRCPINLAFPDGPQGIILSADSMEWVWPDVAEEEERELIIKPEKEYYYKDPTDGKVYTRAELAEKYGMPLGTFNSRLRRGWTIERTCLTTVNPRMRRRVRDADEE